LKISIITATYNSSRVIHDCINSIVTQKYKDIEHIIVDGGSTDETLSSVNSLNNNSLVLVSEPDKGIYDAMNKGIKLATGDIIGFLNSDDFYANENVLLNVANIFKENQLLDGCYADLVYTDQFDISKNIRYWKSCRFLPGLFSKGWCPPHQTFFVRRSVYEKFGYFDLNFSIASDVDLMMRFLEVYKINVRYVPEIWIKMRLGGITNKNFKNIILQNMEVMQALDSYNLDFNFIIFCIHKIISRSSQYFRALLL